MRKAITAFFRMALRIFFRRIEIVGLERAPAGSAVIFAGNHPNGLVDPLFLLCFAERPVSFLGKARETDGHSDSTPHRRRDLLRRAVQPRVPAPARRRGWPILWSKPMTIAAGMRLGPYEVVAALGAGGMGEVWRGRDTRLERDVAIKILPAEFAANVQLRARFDREARTISQLNHAHVCTLFDVGRHDGVDFLVMELIEGESLADRLARGRMPIDLVLRHGSEIASALDAAHRQGIVHRDLKPGNVMLTKSGAKLLDFGLAKSGPLITSSSSSVSILANHATEHRPLTEQGTILGTFQYMAPEQLEGLEADARSDIFAFGALLYEMATGRRAFQGKNKTSLIAAIVSSTPLRSARSRRSRRRRSIT